MDIELFKNTYTPRLMELMKDFHDSEVNRLKQVIESGHYLVVRSERYNYERLAEIKMLLLAYNEKE